jgi:hypothetical protein
MPASSESRRSDRRAPARCSRMKLPRSRRGSGCSVTSGSGYASCPARRQPIGWFSVAWFPLADPEAGLPALAPAEESRSSTLAAPVWYRRMISSFSWSSTPCSAQLVRDEAELLVAAVGKVGELGRRDDGVETVTEPGLDLARGEDLGQPSETGGMDALGEDLREPFDQVGQLPGGFACHPALLLGLHDVLATLQQSAEVGDTRFHLVSRIPSATDLTQGKVGQTVEERGVEDCIH